MEAFLGNLFLGGEFLIGLAVMILGTYIVVQAAKWLAKVSGLSNLFVGATLLSLVTIALELFVCISAVGQGWANLVPTICIGVVLANFGVAMALNLLTEPKVIEQKKFIVQLLSVLVMVLIVWGVVKDGFIDRNESYILLGATVFFVVGNWVALTVGFWNAPKKFKILDWAANKFKKEGKGNLFLNIGRVIMGLILVLVAAGYLLRNSELIARQFNLSRQLVAGTLVVWAVALPALITVITIFARQKRKQTGQQADLSLGNILGVNLMSLSLVLGFSAWLRNSEFLLTLQKWAQGIGEGQTVFNRGKIFAPDVLTSGAMHVNARMAIIDIPLVVAFCLILLGPTLVKGKTYRWQGMVILGAYLIYLFLIFGNS